MGNGYRDIIVAWLRVYHSRANLGTAQDCSEQNERYEQTMDFSGTETFSAPIEEVWTYLADAHKVAACAPGIQDLEEIEPEHWKALVPVGIGPVRTKVTTLDLTRPEAHEPDHMVIKAHGKASGSTVEVVARMHLTVIDAGQTRMEWNAEVTIGGALAGIGTRLMHSASEKLLGQFFTCLKEHLQSPPASDASSSTQAET